MFSISLEYLKPRLSAGLKNPNINSSGTKLTLPLERTALEQVNYTKWFYSDESSRIRKMVKNDFYSFTGKNLIQFDHKENSFELANPVPEKQDDFYFLFDFIKDHFVSKGFMVSDSVMESISHDFNYVEVEIFYLANANSNESISLEVRTNQERAISIKGFCTSEKKKESNFIQTVKEIFEL